MEEIMPPVLILAGGKGTRLSEETMVRPKPMVEIGGRPMLWHIMKTYYHYGCRSFHIAMGYKQDVIVDYFNSSSNQAQFRKDFPEGIDLDLVDTGLETQIAGRIRRILGTVNRTMFVTYGDGLANVNIRNLLAFHRYQGKLATITAINPPPRFGRVIVRGPVVVSFDEKPLEWDYINGGFMVLEPEILQLGEYRDDEIFERVYLPQLAKMEQLSAFCHGGFWRCMDTLREKEELDELWRNGHAQWRVWSD